MSRFRLDWPGVVAFAVVAVAAVVVAVFVDLDAAKVVAGIAGGLLIKLGAVALKGDELDVNVELTGGEKK